MEDLFYVYYTDAARIIGAGQAADITPYLSEAPSFAEIRPDVKGVFENGGKTYGVPRTNYATGLVYNRALFTQAGLNPDMPPKTWAEVQDAAKKIAGLGPGYVGFGEYSAGNTGGWHFTSSIYARGGGDHPARTARPRRSTAPRARPCWRTSARCGGTTTAWAPSSCSAGKTSCG